MASQTSSEAGYRKGLTLPVIILIVVLGIAMFYVNYKMWWHRGITLEPFFGGRIGAPIYLPFGFIWFLAVIALVTRKISVAEIVVLVGSLYFVMDSGFFSFFLEPLVYSYYAQTNENIAKLLNYVPSIWAPRNPALVEQIFTGGGAIPGAIMPSLFLAMVVMFSFLLLNLFAGLAIKEQYIEVEKLPFPAIIPATEVLKYEEEGTLLNFAKQKLFYIGFLIGFLVAFQSTINYIYPIFPTFFAWGQIYLTGWQEFWKGINPSISEWWMFVPVDMLIFYLAPLDVSLSVSIWTGFKALIWPFIAIGLGFIQPGQNPNAGPVKLFHFSYFWVPFALGLWAIIYRYDLWIGYIKKCLGMVKEEVVPGKLPTKMIMFGLVGSFLLYLILFATLGAHVGYLILFEILWFFTLIVMARVWAETGQWPGSGAPYGAVWMTVSAAHSAGIPNPWPSQTWWATKAAMRPTYHLPQATYSAWGAVSTYKLAYDTKTDERDLLIGQIIAIFLAAFVGLYLGLSMLYAEGANNVYTKTWYIKALAARGIKARDIPGVVTREGVLDSTQISHVIAAFIIVGVLWFLRSKFAWWFFTPVALYFYSGMWFLSAVPALILKWLTIKIFGTKAYEEHAVPLVIGAVIGISFGAFVFGSIAALI